MAILVDMLAIKQFTGVLSSDNIKRIKITLTRSISTPAFFSSFFFHSRLLYKKKNAYSHSLLLFCMGFGNLIDTTYRLL